jgi:GntR family transcriptional regulator of vanillate catabolism
MDGMFQKINIPRVRLAEQVYDQILSVIDQGLIGPSDRIVQEKLAEQLQVSRTPIREALFRLEQEGVLTAEDRGGFTIRTATPREVDDIYEARQAVEGYCAAMLASEGNEQKFATINTVIVKTEAAKFTSISQYYNANRDIHHAFVLATGNKYLLEMFAAMWNRSLSFGIFRLLSPEQLSLTLTGHGPLLDAIRTGDPDLARQAMCQHITDGKKLQLSAPPLADKQKA